MALNQMQIIQRLQGVETKSFTCSKEFVDSLFRLHFERKINPFLFSNEGSDYRVLMEKSNFDNLEKYFSDLTVTRQPPPEKKDDNTAPQDDNTAPQDDNTAPQDDNTAPQDDNTAPQDDNTAPQDDN
ncbi:Hypothetical protein BQ3484_498, partial [Cedratvirus A11]